MRMVFSNTYDPAKVFSLGCHSGMASAFASESYERDGFPFLVASASRSTEAALFFSPLRGRVALFLLYIFIMRGGGLDVFGHDV